MFSADSHGANFMKLRVVLFVFTIRDTSVIESHLLNLA